MRRLVAACVVLGFSCVGIVDPNDNVNNTSAVDSDAGVPCTIDLQGTISTIAKGVYCVVGDVIIPSGVTLDIPAGTQFVFKGRYHFGRDPLVPDFEPPAIMGSGNIRAIGTAEEPIVFRGETPDTGWYGIVVSHTHDVLQLEYVTISDALKDDANRNSRIWRVGGGLNSYMNKKGTILRHCTFTNNRALSAGGAVEIFGHGYWPEQGSVEITDTRFEGNACECSLYSSSALDLCGGGGLRLTRVSGDDTLVKIQNNTFINNEARAGGMVQSFGGGLGGSQSGVILGPGNVFEGNSAANGGGAVSCNNEPMMGSVIDEMDPSVTFSNNRPDNGCGR